MRTWLTRMLLAALLITLVHTVNAARSAAPDTAWSHADCDTLVRVTEVFMDARQSGHPMHRTIDEIAVPAIEEFASQLDRKQRKEWTAALEVLVRRVYDLPRQALSGAERADYLSNVYTGCRQQ